MLWGGAREARRLLERGPRRREDAADRHVGEEAEHDEGQQRAQVAGAGAGEVAAGAAAREHHAEAEHQAAQDVARPVQSWPREVHGLVEVDDAGRMQQLGADERGGAGQHPGAEAAPVPEVVDVAERAHGAEIGGKHHGAEQHADGEAAQRQEQRAVLADDVAKRVHVGVVRGPGPISPAPACIDDYAQACLQPVSPAAAPAIARLAGPRFCMCIAPHGHHDS